MPAAGATRAPALAPAGAWNGNGTPQWNGNSTGGHPTPGGYAAPGGTDGWTGHGTGPQPPADGYGAPARPGELDRERRARRHGGLDRPRHRPAAPGRRIWRTGRPGNWTGNGAPGGTGGWTGNGAPPPGSWNGNGAPVPAGWNGNGGPVPAGWNGNGAAGMNGHGPVNGHGTGPWNGMGTATQAPPSGPNSILDGTPLAGPSRRAQPAAGRRSARKQRVQTRSIFSELADLAAIPRTAYALEQESDGAMCLLRTGEGFEVFSAADGARHEVRTFEDEEAAYFYLFGVLAAEAVRNGSLIPPRP